MNRERILFVAVLAIVVLWFVSYEAPSPATGPQPGKLSIPRLPVFGAAMKQQPLKLPDPPPFTLVTNETPHARPKLPLPAARDLPNIWVPTSRSLGLAALGRLRRQAVAVGAEDAATIELPQPEAKEGAETEGAPAPERIDQWESFTRVNKGRVTGLHLRGQARLLRPPQEFPEAVLPIPRYYRLLTLLEADPDKAASEGVVGVEVEFEGGGRNEQSFPDEISAFRIAIEGRQKGWFQGARALLQLPDKGYERRKTTGRKLLEEGRDGKDNKIVEWALTVLSEARKMVPAEQQNVLRDILMLQLEAANLLNRQEMVLELGFEHLSRFQRDPVVLEYMGNILSSRSYGLAEMAIGCYERATNSREAQRRRAALLIRLGRMDEARDVLDSGVAGGGPEVDLLRARVALALGDYETAIARAGAHAGGSGADAAEANQILGGVKYAQGDAAAAEQHFLAAVNADPGRSTAYSDLGLALAVQGKGADALVCFERAAALDFENSVIPRLGAAFLKLTAAENALVRKPDPEEENPVTPEAMFNEALADLTALQGDNPRDLLVRYYLAYAKEKTGDLEGAATDLRSTLDEDHRYRIAIARLGIVQARRREDGGEESLVRPAVAHLTKAAELNPTDATVAYILGRFLMHEDIRRQAADSYLARAKELPAPAQDANLPLWASAARAALLYRDESQDVLHVRSLFNRVIDNVRDQGTRSGATDVVRYVADHPVGQYATRCRDIVSEASTKVDVVWIFKTEPRDWEFIEKTPMQVDVSGKRGIHFHGQVNFQGQERDHNTRLQYCAVKYEDNKLTGNSFFELEIEGEIPPGTLVDVGMGLVGTGRTKRKGRSGLQVRRRASDDRIDVRLEGGGTERFKRNKARDYIEMTKVRWPAGKFTFKIRVDDRDSGNASLWLNGQSVFGTELGQDADRCILFGKGRGSRPVTVVIWVEGNDGDSYKDIYINKVTLVRARGQ